MLVIPPVYSLALVMAGNWCPTVNGRGYKHLLDPESETGWVLSELLQFLRKHLVSVVQQMNVVPVDLAVRMP